MATNEENLEHRSEPRFRVKWRVTTLLGDGDPRHGFIKDISIKGAAILLERNLHIANTITLHIHIPPLNVGNNPRIVEIQGKFIYSVHDHDELFFRTGIHFVKFKTESDRTYLLSRLTNHHMEIKD